MRQRGKWEDDFEVWKKKIRYFFSTQNKLLHNAINIHNKCGRVVLETKSLEKDNSLGR